MHLRDICAILTGYTARSRLEPVESGGVLVVQGRDVGVDGDVDALGLMRISLDGGIDRYVVGPGDVVFRSRGDRNNAAALDQSFPEGVVALQPLIILRPKPALVLPSYLAWAINHPNAQRQLAVMARGTGIQMVPKTSLTDLDLDIPDLETQHRIVLIGQLARSEASLAAQLAEKRRALTNLVLADCAAQSRHRRLPERNEK